MTPEAVVHVPVAMVTVQVNMPAVIVDPMRKMDPVTVDAVRGMDAVRNMDTVHTGTAAATDTVTMTAAAAALRACIGTSGGESCNADNGRRDEGEESRTFEHGRGPFFGSMWAIRTIGRGVAAIGSTD